MAQACVITMVCVSITAPAIVVSQSLPYFKVEQLLIPVALLVYLWLLLTGIARPFRLNGMFLVGLLYLICNLLSIIYGTAVLGHSLILKDFYEFPKLWLPVAFFTITYEAELSETGLKRVVTFFSFAALLVCLYAWGQFAGAGWAFRLNPYYSSGGAHIELPLLYAQRVYGTVGNANMLGILMTWCVMLFVSAALLRVGSRLYFSLASAACLITLVMTGSRYGLVTVALGLLIIVGPNSLVARRSYLRLALGLVLIAAVFLSYSAIARTNVRILARYQALENPLQVDSYRQRVDEIWPMAWAEIQRSPILGHGPGKSFLPVGLKWGVLDSEYLSVLTEFGILGLAVFLGYYLYPLYVMRKGFAAASALSASQRDQVSANLMCLQASFIMGVLAIVMGIGMGTFYYLFIQGILFLWLGIGARSAKTIYETVRGSRASVASRVRPVPQAGRQG